MKIAVIQMDISFGKPVENLKKAEEMVRKAAQKRPDVIILPEMWNTSYDLKNVSAIADRAGSPNAKKIGELAKEFGINIIAGSVADKSGDKVYNTSYIFNRQGDQIAKYSKIHLFGLMNEGEYLERGNERCIFELDGITCGLMICYELRFPELSRALALDGAQIIFVPAQWPHPRMHPWLILTQARAIENQLFLVAVNRVGKEDKAEFFGHSMVVDPLGDVIYEGGEQEEIKIVELDLNKVEEVRNKMTCFADRVEEVYK
ncbi:MAG: omega-amidase [Clostridia bacterium]|jgi:predicted amidohydrolase|nr:omega-amidase [Clostridia bacterium]MDN5322633.1 omega-amidase [Clostridia bacterium]